MAACAWATDLQCLVLTGSDLFLVPRRARVARFTAWRLASCPVCEPGEIAKAALFPSEASSFVNAVSLFADGVRLKSKAFDAAPWRQS